jgi:hypothetical protein
MKALPILAASFFAPAAFCQLIPVTPAEAQIASIAQAASASQYYLELSANSLSRLHGTIFISDDATLEATLEKLGPQKSSELLGLYFASATAVNQLLAGTGSTVRAPVEQSREWVWSGTNCTVTPIPEPTPAE